jgi:hypothetical protein
VVVAVVGWSRTLGEEWWSEASRSVMLHQRMALM